MENRQPEKQRLSKIMAQAGVASRRRCEEMIFKGQVTVNGEVVQQPQTLVDRSDRILIDNSPLPPLEKKVYYLLNKPRGYLCSNSSQRSEKIVIDLFKKKPYRLFTVGRLDKETTGLLLLTNDGHFAQKVIHPSSSIEKEYLAEVDQAITQKELLTIRKGTEVEGTFVRPAKVEKIGNKKLRMVVMEGKKREVRILIQNAGLNVVTLSRTRIGKLTLGTLHQGEWREMKEQEKQLIFTKGP